MLPISNRSPARLPALAPRAPEATAAAAPNLCRRCVRGEARARRRADPGPGGPDPAGSPRPDPRPVPAAADREEHAGPVDPPGGEELLPGAHLGRAEERLPDPDLDRPRALEEGRPGLPPGAEVDRRHVLGARAPPRPRRQGLRLLLHRDPRSLGREDDWRREGGLDRRPVEGPRPPAHPPQGDGGDRPDLLQGPEGRELAALQERRELGRQADLHLDSAAEEGRGHPARRAEEDPRQRPQVGGPAGRGPGDVPPERASSICSTAATGSAETSTRSASPARATRPARS